MRIARMIAYVPLLEINLRIEHATPRRPTAFEGAILGVVNTVATHEQYRSWTLERAFREMFMVPNGGRLVRETMRELEAIGVIGSQPGRTLTEESTLEEVVLSGRGRDMIARGLLPSRSLVDDAVVHYDPIGERIVTRGEYNAAVRDPGGAIVPPQGFLDFVPRELVRGRIADLRFEWYREGSEIVDIAHIGSETAWKQVDGWVERDGEDIRFECTEKSYANYVTALGEKFIMAALGARLESAATPDARAGESNGTPTCDVDKGFYWMSERAALDAVGRAEGTWLVDAKSMDRTVELAGLQGAAVVLYGASGPALEVEWDERRNACIVRTCDEFPLRNTFLSSNRQLYHGKTWTICIGDRRWITPLVQVIPMEKPRRDVVLALRALGEKLIEGAGEAGLSVAARFLAPGEFWDLAAQAIMRAGLPVDTALQRLRDVHAVVSRSGDLADHASLGDAVSAVVESAMGRGKEIELEAARGAAKTLKSMSALNAAVRDATLSKIASNICGPGSLRELQELKAFVKGMLPASASLGATRFYSPSLYKEMADGYRNPKMAEAVMDIDDFGRAYGAVHLNALRHGPVTSLMADAESARSWVHEVSGLLLAHPAFAHEAANTRLTADLGAVLRAVIDRDHGTSPVDVHARKVVVIDPRALLVEPSILGDLARDITVLVPMDSYHQVANADMAEEDEEMRNRALRALVAARAGQVIPCDPGGLTKEGASSVRIQVMALAHAFKDVAVLVSDSAYFKEAAVGRGILMWTVSNFMMRKGRKKTPRAEPVESGNKSGKIVGGNSESRRKP